MGSETIQASPYDPAAEVLIDKAIDGHAGRAGNTFDGLMWNDGMANAVSKHRDEEDDVSLRQLRKPRKELLQREFGQVGKRNPILERTELSLGRREKARCRILMCPKRQRRLRLPDAD